VDERVPSYSVPSGVPADDPAQFALANGQSAFRASTREGEVEPINLLQSAGPAIAKRLAPVAVALVVVLIAARRRSNKRG
jgi:hypothetical protein